MLLTNVLKMIENKATNEEKQKIILAVNNLKTPIYQYDRLVKDCQKLGLVKDCQKLGLADYWARIIWELYCNEKILLLQWCITIAEETCFFCQYDGDMDCPEGITNGCKNFKRKEK